MYVLSKVSVSLDATWLVRTCLMIAVLTLLTLTVATTTVKTPVIVPAMAYYGISMTGWWLTDMLVQIVAEDVLPHVLPKLLTEYLARYIPFAARIALFISNPWFGIAWTLGWAIANVV